MLHHKAGWPILTGSPTILQISDLAAAEEPSGPLGPQRAIGRHHGGPGGPLGFSGLGKIPVKPFPGRVWGEIGTPKRFLGTMETIPLLKNPVKPRGGPNPPQKHVFQAPLLGPQRGPGLRGPRPGPGAPKMGSRVENIKVAG